MILQADGSASIVLIHFEVVTTIERYTDPAERNREAGGILIGSYRGPHIEIVSCTSPMPQDIRTPVLFNRRDPGHDREAKRRWQESGRVQTFVGEWHTHPEKMPLPSRTDRVTWSAVMKSHAPHSLVFLIRGFAGAWYGFGRAGVVTRFLPAPTTDADNPADILPVPIICVSP